MRRTVITAALLAAFAIPAFADDLTVKKDASPDVTNASATAGQVSKEGDAKPVYVEQSRPDCMHHSTALNMM